MNTTDLLKLKEHQANHVLSIKISTPQTRYIDLEYMPLLSELQAFETTMDSVTLFEGS